MKSILVISTITLLINCAAGTIDPVVNHYHSVKSQINLGMTNGDFNTLLGTSQSKLDMNQRKPSETFTKDGSIYEVIYIRSARVPDGAITDDEFTPYVFVDGELAEIGWLALGGMKRTSQDVARERAEIQKAQASSTKVKQTIKVTK